MVSVVTLGGESFHFDVDEVKASGVDWTWLLRDRLEARLGVSGYCLRFVCLDGDVSYETKSWEEVGCPSELQVLLTASWHSDRCTELCKAAEAGRVGEVRSLLEATANPNGAEEEDSEETSDLYDLFFDDEEKRFPLWQAAFYGHDEVVQLLLRAKADKEKLATDGATALHAACGSVGNAKVVSTLLGARAQCGLRQESGLTPLGYAAKAGFPEAVRQLLAAAAQLQADDWGRTPLLFCASEKGPGYVEVAKLLLQHQAEVNVATSHGSPLTSAVHADAEMTTVLLEARAAVNQADPFGQSALWLACRYGRMDLMAALLSAKADVEQADDHQVSPLECCALFSEDVEMVKRLVAMGASTEKLLSQWEELQHLAADEDELEEITEYIEALRVAKECTKSWVKRS